MTQGTTASSKQRKSSNPSKTPIRIEASGKKNLKTALPVNNKPLSAKATAEQITNYGTAMKWLFGHTDYEQMRIVPYNKQTFSLDRVRKLLDLFGNPQEELQCIQVAGTKGKGSTCAMIASMLDACGYTVGLYSSPHLIDLRERIMINGQMISYGDMTELMKTIAGKMGSMASDPPSFFEIMTAAALRYFADQAVDIVVLETGLGGRLDATTVVKPLVCGITHVSLDHMHILGKDLALIAKEKAGIFKSGVPALSVEQDPVVTTVLEEAAQQCNAPLEVTGKQIEFSYRFEANRELGPHTRVSITTPSSRWEHLAVPLRGEHQAHNCGLALAMLDKLKSHGFIIPEDKVVSGLAATKLPGRMEQVWSDPRIIVDGAHNAASIQALIRALGAHIAYDSLILIFGCGQDKDVNGMLKQISLGADKVIFTSAKNNTRGMDPEELLTRFNDLSSKMAQTAPTLEGALRLAGRAVSREDLIVVTGSFYLVGEAKKYFIEYPAKNKKRK